MGDVGYIDAGANARSTRRAIGGLTMGADGATFITAGVAATRGRSLHAFSVRKEVKDHGAGGRIAGVTRAGRPRRDHRGHRHARHQSARGGARRSRLRRRGACYCSRSWIAAARSRRWRPRRDRLRRALHVTRSGFHRRREVITSRVPPGLARATPFAGAIALLGRVAEAYDQRVQRRHDEII